MKDKYTIYDKIYGIFGTILILIALIALVQALILSWQIFHPDFVDACGDGSCSKPKPTPPPISVPQPTPVTPTPQPSPSPAPTVSELRPSPAPPSSGGGGGGNGLLYCSGFFSPGYDKNKPDGGCGISVPQGINCPYAHGCQVKRFYPVVPPKIIKPVDVKG